MMKNGITIRYDYEEAFDLLTNEELGQLIRALLDWGEGREVPDLSSIAEVAFLFIIRDMEQENKVG